jgi:hypothetical protein
MAGGELRLGTASMYMAIHISDMSNSKTPISLLRGYILAPKSKLSTPNQTLEVMKRGKFSLGSPIWPQ